ncbi:hypothetical protein BST81_22905 [Leptolyngbya sp. 'hensonii']|uniref:hypothetical protein n=1 Tax=Leptolyngbya sp. 'hensonii' TaxID=1922337 RepID=UPI00094F7D22|nr:hypothetical protein [Leptolyngbya sp. 'hensonii']OLP16080.1 hypothetical protein BST81_22905 [Leptolyngbya sp. 'hensonii']
MKQGCWLIYALGGGWGHLTRALSLARVVARQYSVKVLTNSVYAAGLPAEEGAHLHIIPPKAGLRATCRQVEQLIHDLDYCCLVVDTFPRGLGGELASMPRQKHGIPRVLIHRDISPKYVESKYLRAFVLTQFDRILVPGECNLGAQQTDPNQNLPLADLPQVHHTLPWLIRDAHELPDEATARSHLRLPAALSKKVVLVLASGRVEELPWFGEVARTLADYRPDLVVRLLSVTCPDNCPLELWVTHWPAIETMIVADVVIGSAGYNTFYECQALGVPLVARPFWRLYDRQSARIQRWLGYQSQSSALDWPVMSVQDTRGVVLAVEKLLQRERPHTVPTFVNGAIAAMQEIEQLLNGG